MQFARILVEYDLVEEFRRVGLEATLKAKRRPFRQMCLIFLSRSDVREVVAAQLHR